MNDLIAITVIIGGFITLVILARWLCLGLGFVFWNLCGSFDSANRIIAAYHEAEREKLDTMARRGFREANKQGWIK